MNPVKKIRKDKNLALFKFARLINSNHFSLDRVEKGVCKKTTYLTIIKKTSLAFDNIDDKKLFKEYKNWRQENEISIKK